MVRLLLAHAATDVNQVMAETGFTPLLFACQYGFKNVVRLLLENGADPSIESTKPGGLTALAVAERKGHKGMVALLSSPIPIGSRVELRALQAKPELNGRRGVVKNFIVEEGRCVVQLVGGDEGEKGFKLMPQNLAVLN